MLYATDFRWWDAKGGVSSFSGLKICQDPKIARRPDWNVRRVEVDRMTDRLVQDRPGVIGWGGNSGFGALNLAVQWGANPIILVGYDMRLDRGIHWHGIHGRGLTNPIDRNVARWRRAIDDVAPVLAGLGIRVFNASPVSALRNYPKINIDEALLKYAHEAEPVLA